MAKVGGDGATRAIVRVLSEADDLIMRRVAALALGGLPGQDARTALERAKLDVNPAVVEVVEQALERWQKRFGQ